MAKQRKPTKRYTDRYQQELLARMGIPHKRGRTFGEAKRLIKRFVDQGKLPRNAHSPPTWRQLEFLRGHGIKHRADITSEEASARVEWILQHASVVRMSQKQRDFIEILGGIHYPDMTRDQASQFIDVLLPERPTCPCCGSKIDAREGRCERGHRCHVRRVRPPAAIYQRKGLAHWLGQLFGGRELGRKG